MDELDRLNDFYRVGSDWICRQCEAQQRRERPTSGSADLKPPIARWTDKTRRILTCPHCGMTEPVERS